MGRRRNLEKRVAYLSAELAASRDGWRIQVRGRTRERDLLLRAAAAMENLDAGCALVEEIRNALEGKVR